MLPHASIRRLQVAFDSRAPDRLTALCSFEDCLSSVEVKVERHLADVFLTLLLRGRKSKLSQVPLPQLCLAFRCVSNNIFPQWITCCMDFRLLACQQIVSGSVALPLWCSFLGETHASWDFDSCTQRRVVLGKCIKMRSSQSSC